MNRKRMFALHAIMGAVPGWLIWLLLAACLLSCMDGDRVAGSSTEAGNAGGKLSLSDGSPAAGVSVALVARTFVPDTAGLPEGDKPGAYYRTRTGPDGRYVVEDMAPGSYCVLARGAGIGVMTDSVVVNAGPETTLVDAVMKPLGSIHGVVKLVGSEAKVNLWVSPVGTVLMPPMADSAGNFHLDSLPEGEYDLLPQCYSCARADEPYRVKVRAGKDTLLPDTLKLYPEIMTGFPEAGDYVVRTAYTPPQIGGKWHDSIETHLRPTSAIWTWNGMQIPGEDIRTTQGLGGTQVTMDAAIYGSASTGRLRVVLLFADTMVSRVWDVRIDRSRIVYPLLAVESDSAARIPGPNTHNRWRVRVTDTRPFQSGDVAFWGLQDLVSEPRPDALPGWMDLSVTDALDTVLIRGQGPRRLTFILVPDSLDGGRIFRPRRDERLEDFGHIRLFDRGRLGFADSVVPSMTPEGLILDRIRGNGIRQRYFAATSGRMEEILGSVEWPGLPALAAQPPLLFYRTGYAGAGFDWERPARDAAKALAVTREGDAWFLDGSPAPVKLPAKEMEALDSLLAPLKGEPPAWRDTSVVAGPVQAYLRYGSRGVFRSAADGDTLLRAFSAWLGRNGLSAFPRAFPLASATWRFQGFRLDPANHETGDTLVLELQSTPDGAEVREYLAPGSPALLAGDTAVLAYRLFQDEDTLRIKGAALSAPSRILGSLDGARALFPVAGLRPVTAAFENGLPVLDGGGNLLSGRLDGALSGWGRNLVSPGVLLDGRGIALGLQGSGFLYTRDGGLERAWRFGGRSGVITGWNRL